MQRFELFAVLTNHSRVKFGNVLFWNARTKNCLALKFARRNHSLDASIGNITATPNIQHFQTGTAVSCDDQKCGIIYCSQKRQMNFLQPRNKPKIQSKLNIVNTSAVELFGRKKTIPTIGASTPSNNNTYILSNFDKPHLYFCRNGSNCWLLIAEHDDRSIIWIEFKWVVNISNAPWVSQLHSRRMRDFSCWKKTPGC